METTAKNLKVGDRFQSTSSIQEVTEIISTTDKAITFRTKRISPCPYDGNFFNRKRLDTKIIITN
jgi:hypothetical protein